MAERFIIYLVLFCTCSASAQKYNFVNWTVEDGLIQSQAFYICQDHYRQLWIGTEGGISRFDGRKFTAFTIQDGLASNHINTMLCDHAGNMWIGTNNGISVYNGRHFETMRPLEGSLNNITQIVQNKNEDDIYAIDNFNLFKINRQCKKINLSEDSAEKITALYFTNKGQLLISVHKKGILLLQKNTGILLAELNEEQKAVVIGGIYINSKNDTLLATNKGLYSIKKNRLVLFEANHKTITDNIYCIAEDSKQNIWLGTDKGAFKIEAERLIHFDEKSGFTDNSVEHIYKDIENNLWFATNADGIFKFRENTFIYYDKSSGLLNTIVMGITQTSDGSIYTAGYGGGLYKLNSKNAIEPVIYGGSVLSDCKINCLYADDENNIWIGTLNKDTYVYNKKRGLKKIEAKNNPDLMVRGATVFLKEANGNLLIGSNRGLFLMDKNNNISRIKLPAQLITALKQFDGGHVLIGTAKGIFLLDKNDEAKPFNEKKFGNSSVLCLAKNNENIWIGTTDKGIMNWNYKTGKTITYTTANGLPSNFIYSIDVSDEHKAWVGTGFGISNIQLNDEGKINAIKNYGLSDGLLGMECNHNCLLRASDSSFWFGTTKGLFHFNPYPITEKNQPLVLLRSVKLFSSDITDGKLFKNPGAWFKAPEGLKLHSKQNHLTFELGSIYFTNPEDMLYHYKLAGIDKEFTTTNNPYIIYPALPPGKYTLIVTGITKNGTRSFNEIAYTFEIEKAFYQTRFFQVFIILLLLGTGALLAYIFTRTKQKRKHKAKELLEKIREEEFIKLRQRTAEDFHDEMGNSLTRISVLTDVLKSKLNGKEQEVSRLVQQIKDNTAALYSGSRDIIWSLNTQNDGLYQIAEHIKDIGHELFQETNIDLQYRHNINPGNPLKLKLDYSRNLTMIFKEVYNNVLKHAKANVLTVFLNLSNANELEITIRDNGKGFDPDLPQNGNGIKNMKNRAARMHGDLGINTEFEKGTRITIRLRNIFI